MINTDFPDYTKNISIITDLANGADVPDESVSQSTLFTTPFSFEFFWGCHEDVFHFIGSITRLSLVLRDDTDVRDALLSRPHLLADVHRLEETMLQWDPSTDLPRGSPRRDVSMKSSSIFRDAALLYLYRLILDTKNSDVRVQSATESLFNTLGKG